MPSAAMGAVLVMGAIISVLLARQPEARMVIDPAFSQTLLGQSSGGDDRSGNGPKTYQRIRKTALYRAATYGFRNFNKDSIEVSYQIAEKDFRTYYDSFGYTKAGLDEVKRWRDNARQNAYKLILREGKSQAQLDYELASLDKEYDQRLKGYLDAHGFRMLKGNMLAVDMPHLVRRNAALIKPLSLAFEKIANAQRYRSDEIIGAVLSFVQTALYYKEPPSIVQEKHTGGVLPPLAAVLAGWGDCDTKTGLLASVLSNWAQMRMVGVGVPGHYLMGVLLIPEKGDLFLEYQGLQYVLVEPAGPAWLPPGQVGEETLRLINGREGYKIEPFY